jgi:hypothetical protein
VEFFLFFPTCPCRSADLVKIRHFPQLEILGTVRSGSCLTQHFGWQEWIFFFYCSHAYLGPNNSFIAYFRLFWGRIQHINLAHWFYFLPRVLPAYTYHFPWLSSFWLVRCDPRHTFQTGPHHIRLELRLDSSLGRNYVIQVWTTSSMSIPFVSWARLKCTTDLSVKNHSGESLHCASLVLLPCSHSSSVWIKPTLHKCRVNQS